MRLDVELEYDGDILKGAKIKKGRQIRPLWRKMEHFQPQEMIIWADRFDSLCPIASEWALAQAVEESLSMKIPHRTQCVRTVLCELNKLVWLTTYLGRVCQALGQRTIFQQIFVLRESVFNIQEELTGGRILPQAFKIGGTRRELALGNVQKIKAFVGDWKISWTSWLALVRGDRLLESRLKNLLPVEKILAEHLGWWGVVGKASGLSYDSRRHRPHGAYPFVEVREVMKTGGDALARFEVAMDEVNLSLELMEKLLNIIASEPVAPTEVKELGTLKPGFFTAAAESAKGPIISCIEVGDQHRISTVRLFSTGQRVWPVLEQFFKDMRAEDFQVGFASLGIDDEDSEI